MQNPYIELMTMTLGNGLLCSKLEIEFYSSWNCSTCQLEPSIELFNKMYAQDSISALSSMSESYITHFIDNEGLDEDFHYYWSQAQEEVNSLVAYAKEEFLGTNPYSEA